MDEKIAPYQALRRSKQDEIARRVQIHQSKISRASARMKAAKPAVPSPLAMLAHGDSWFDYPLSGNTPILGTTDIVEHLQNMGSPNPFILNLSQWGDATTTEMSWPKQQEVITQLQNASNWFSGKPDAILISGGGNDVAGDQFCIFLDDAPTGLDAVRFSDVLGMIEASYSVLFALRDKYAPGVPIFGHCYDFAVPDGRATFCAGPWLGPSLSFCGYTVAQGTPLVHQALQDFKKKLAGFQAVARNNFILVDTQGTLNNPDYTQDWANELHPYPEGFGAVAGKFLAALRARFPGRV
jgi:hypothetical protein